MSALEFLLIGSIGALCGALVAGVVKDRNHRREEDKKFREFQEAMRKTQGSK